MSPVCRFLIFWSSCKQNNVELSSAETESIAMCESCYDAKHIKTCLSELFFFLITASPLYLDNVVANIWPEIVDNLHQANHLDLNKHFEKDAAKNGKIEPQYIMNLIKNTFWWRQTVETGPHISSTNGMVRHEMIRE